MILEAAFSYFKHFLERSDVSSRFYSGQQYGHPFCSLVLGFRQKAVNWGSVSVRQFDASEGTLFATSIAM